jgi:hypothetical protein
MDNYLTQRLELVCANQPVYVPGVLGAKGARGYVSVFMNEDWQRTLKPGDPNYPVAVVVNGFSSKNMEAGKTGPAEFIAGLSLGHTFRAELRVRTKREFIIHPDTKQILTTESGAQRYNVVEFRSLGSYFRFGRDGRKFEDEQVATGLRHAAWDGKISMALLQGWLAEAQKSEPQGGAQTNLLTAMMTVCTEGPAHEQQRRMNDRAPYVIGAPTFRNALVKQDTSNAYGGGGGGGPADVAGFAAQIANAAGAVKTVQTGFTPKTVIAVPPVLHNPLTPALQPQTQTQTVQGGQDGYNDPGQQY